MVTSIHIGERVREGTGGSEPQWHSVRNALLDNVALKVEGGAGSHR